MPAIPLFGLGIAAKSPTVTAKLMTNFYAETRPAGEHSMLVAYGTPGLELFCDVEEIARGALEFEKNATAFVVAGDTLWEIDGNGVKTNRGTLLTSSGRVSMAHNGVQIMMVDGFNGYIYNTVTIVFAQITDTDFPAGPQTVCYLARRFIVNFIDSSRFYVSDIDDGLSWDALMFANAEANPDPIIAVWSSTGQLVLLGANTTEFWGNSGTLDFPFVALQGAANEWGMDAVASIAKYDNTFAWLVRNRMGQVMVAQMNGYLPKKISSIDIDHIINTYFATTDAVAYSYMLGGHPMYVISFPSVTPVAPEAQADEETPEAVTRRAARDACVPVAPDPMPDRVLYLGVVSTVPVGAGPITTLSTATKWVWTTLDDFLSTTIHVAVVSDVGVQVIANFAPVSTAGNVTTLGIADIASIGEVWVLTRGHARYAYIARFSAGTAALDGTASVAPAFIAWLTIADGPLDATYIGYDPVTDKVWIAYSFTNATATVIGIVDPHTMATEFTNVTGLSIGHVFQFVFAFPYVAAVGRGGSGGNPNFVVFNASSYATLYSLTVSRSSSGKVADYDSVRARFVVVPDTGMIYTLVDAATGATTTELLSLAVGHDTVPPPNDSQIKGVTYYARLDLYIFGENSGTTIGSTLYIVDPVTFASQSTYTYETGAANLLINTLFEPLTDGDLGDYVLGFDRTSSSTTSYTLTAVVLAGTAPPTVFGVIGYLSSGFAYPAGGSISPTQFNGVDILGLLQPWSPPGAIPFMQLYFEGDVGAGFITTLTINGDVYNASDATYLFDGGTNRCAFSWDAAFILGTLDAAGTYTVTITGAAVDESQVKRLYLGEPCPGSGVSPDPPPPDPTPDPRGPGGIGGGPVDQTWLYDGSTGFWSKLKSFGIDRHRVQFSYQCAGQTIGADYANGKQYRVTDTALSDNGEAIEGEIIGETLTMPDEAFLTVNKVRVGMEVGVGNTLAPGDNPQVSLSVARDSGAKQFGAEMWKPLGKTGEFHTRLEWRRLGTTRYFTAKLRITDAVKRVIVGASINPSD